MGFYPRHFSTVHWTIEIASRPFLFESPCKILLDSGGDDGIRTHDPLLAGQVLSQLSYTPIYGLPPLFSFQSFSVRAADSLKIEQQIHSTP